MVGFCIGVIFFWLWDLDSRITKIEEKRDDK